ncbi:hypothetical protein [Oceanospirillum linum]|uniref:DUF2628 domain-containing protein n=1 Tax=Oceanospirillum linum TaxID=966 RepID=A0A1T1HG56_OCELI|nr:hypothetical protein [Oceanospirillum linum]OOV88839.1 hypothetical protein BTA35_0205060 [Oceanospirillum linum]SEG49623.1 hypothetical protein SAMN04489856_11326 [Oleiphilus messinensis]SMP22814.1 hypothetical protein SAMN06264348_104288 [Oceanospirillum linum]
MQIYRVYQHPQRGYAAITSGFNWTAALFSLIWTLSNNLWGPSFLLFLGWSTSIAGIFIAGMMGLPMVSMTFVGLAVLMPLWAGMNAMKWLDQGLQKQGYNLVNKVRAQTSQGAIMTTQRKLDPTAARKRSASRR